MRTKRCRRLMCSTQGNGGRRVVVVFGWNEQKVSRVFLLEIAVKCQHNLRKSTRCPSTVVLRHNSNDEPLPVPFWVIGIFNEDLDTQTPVER